MTKSFLVHPVSGGPDAAWAGLQLSRLFTGDNPNDRLPCYCETRRCKGATKYLIHYSKPATPVSGGKVLSVYSKDFIRVYVSLQQLLTAKPTYEYSLSFPSFPGIEQSDTTTAVGHLVPHEDGRAPNDHY